MQVKNSNETIGLKEYLSLELLYEQPVLRAAHNILADPLHVLHTEYELFPSEDGTDFQCVGIIVLKSILYF